MLCTKSMIKAQTRTGQLDQQITLKAVTQGVDSHGGPTETLTTIETVFAKVDFPAVGSGENYSDAVNLATNRVQFTFHYRTDFDERSRITWNERDYDIIRISHDGRRMFSVVDTEYKK